MRSNLIVDILSDRSDVGYSPSQIKKAYSISDYNAGEGISVGVIDFMGNVNIRNNLDVFSNEFGLLPAQIEFFGGTPSNDRFDFSAYIEPSADVQWIHAVSPKCVLKVFRAKQYSVEGAIEATEQSLKEKCDIVLQSFQAPFLETYIDYLSLYDSDAVFVCSAGDYGAGAFFPSCYPTNISVGGTSLQLDIEGNRISEETVWNNTGGGVCKYFDIPDYQKRFEGISYLTSDKRGVPDISFLADPATGFAVYHSSVSGSFGWYRAGGTSIGAAVISGVIANYLSGTNDVDKRSILPMLYNIAGGYRYENRFNKFIDIVTGSNNEFEARVGFDLCTGLGSLVNL